MAILCWWLVPNRTECRLAYARMHAHLRQSRIEHRSNNICFCIILPPCALRWKVGGGGGSKYKVTYALKCSRYPIFWLSTAFCRYTCTTFIKSHIKHPTACAEAANYGTNATELYFFYINILLIFSSTACCLDEGNEEGKGWEDSMKGWTDFSSTKRVG